MQKEIKLFRNAILSGDIIAVHEFLKKYQHDDIANWILDEQGRAALHYLASRNFFANNLRREMLIYLLSEYGADVNLKDKSGKTPLYEECLFSNPSESLIRFFIKKGADVRVVINSGKTILFSPILYGETAIVDILLDAGANDVIDAIDERGDAAIHGALTYSGNDGPVLINRLISAGANINLQNKAGRTLLHLNVLHYKNEEITRLLLNAEANYSIEDINGVSALQEAARIEFHPLIDWVIEKRRSIEDGIEKIKIVLLENPSLRRPDSLNLPALRDQWTRIQQELRYMKNRKIEDTPYFFYDILVEKNPEKLSDLISNKKVVEALNDPSVSEYPSFSEKIETLQNYAKKIEGTAYSIFDIYKEKDQNRLAAIFLNSALENKVRELIDQPYLNSIIKETLRKNLETGTKRRNLLKTSMEYYHDPSEINYLPSEMIEAILKFLPSVKLKEISAAKAITEGNAEDIFSILRDLDQNEKITVFSVVFRYLNSAQRTYILHKIKEKLSSIIHSADDFIVFTKHLDHEQRTIVFDHIKETFSSFLLSSSFHVPADVQAIAKQLNREELLYVLGKIKDELLLTNVRMRNFPSYLAQYFSRGNSDSSIYYSVGYAIYFSIFLENLAMEQRTDLLNEIKNCLPLIIRHVDDFILLLKHLNAEQITLIFEASKEKSLIVTRNGDNLPILLRPSNAEQPVIVIAGADGELSSFPLYGDLLYESTINADRLSIVLEHLNPEQRIYALDNVIEKLLSIIKRDHSDHLVNSYRETNHFSIYFSSFFKQLSSKQRLYFFDRIKEKLPSLIRNSYDFYFILENLNSEQRMTAFYYMKEKLPLLIHSADELSTVLKHLTPEQRTMLDKLLEPFKEAIKSSESLKPFDLEKCLPGPSKGRIRHNHRKRKALGKSCEISWEEVDEFNGEKEKIREFSQIKIESHQFLSFFENPLLSEIQRAQLLELAAHVPVTGTARNRVSSLVRYQQTLAYLNKIARVSGRVTQGMMVKNMLRDFLQEDYQGVAINLGFMVGGQGFATVAEAAAIHGSKFLFSGQRLLGQSLKIASPFLARGTSVFIVYDLVNQKKAYEDGNPDAMIGIVGDSIYLSIDAVEIGVETAEIIGLLEGVSSATGPIGATIGAVVFIAMDVYFAVKQVNEIDKLIHLSHAEKFIEGLRAFVGLKPEQHIQRLLEEKKGNNALFIQGINFLKKNMMIRRYILPTVKVVQKCTTTLIDSACRPVGRGAYGRCSSNSRVRSFVPKEVVGQCTHKLEMKLDNLIMLDEKRNTIKWSRTKPDVIQGSLVCAPTGNDVEIPNEGTYRCDNAMGIEYSDFRTGNATLITLGDGRDTLVGFPDGDHVVILGNGYKNVSLGGGNDTFLLEGNRIQGVFRGGNGTNRLDLGSFAKEQKTVFVELTDTVGHVYANAQANSTDDSLKVYDITHFLLRKNKQDFLQVACNTSIVDAGGGQNKDHPDRIVIPENNHCGYVAKLVIRPYTNITNYGKNGQFTYLIPTANAGEATVSLLNEGGSHEFLFAYTLYDIDRLEKTDNKTTFDFIQKEVGAQVLSKANTTENEFTLRIIQRDTNQVRYLLSDHTEIKVGENSLYALQNTNRSTDNIIKNYPHIANRLNFSIIVRTSITNESIIIGTSNHDVLHNDPSRQSHLIGNGGENIFVITSGYEVLEKEKLPLPEVIIYDKDDENLIDTLDLSGIKNQLEKDLGLEIKAKTSLQATDILIELCSTAYPAENFITTRLKDALIINWHKRLYIIVNHVPMQFDKLDLKPVPLAFSPDKDIIVISPEDVEENTKLVIPRKSGNYRFTRLGDNLLMSNAWDSNLMATERYALSLQRFYQSSKLETLVIQFADKKVVLKNEMVNIVNATDFSVEREQFRSRLYDRFLNETLIQASMIPVSASHYKLERQSVEKGTTHYEAIDKKEANKNTQGMMASYTSYLWPALGVVATAVFYPMVYRCRSHRRVREGVLPTTVAQIAVVSPLLSATTVEAKLIEKNMLVDQSKLDYLGDQEIHSEWTRSGVTGGFDGNVVGNFSLVKYVLYYLGWDSVVARINEAESVLASANDSVDPLDLLEQSVKKAIGSGGVMCNPKSNYVSRKVEKKVSTFFQDCSDAQLSLHETRHCISYVR